MKYKDAAWLREQYWEKGLTQLQIAKMCEVSRRAIGKWMVKHGIPRRVCGNDIYKEKDWLHQKYWEEGLTTIQIAQLCGVVPQTISNWMKVFSIPMKTHSYWMKETWKSGKFDGVHAAVGGDRQYKHRDWLYEQYWEREMGLKDIGRLCGANAQTVLNWMVKFGIERRDQQEDISRKRRRGTLGHPIDEATRTKIAAGVKEAWNRGDFDGNSDSRKKAWANGAYDGVFRSPTSIETAVANVLDIVSVDHDSQYRPLGYRRVYDEFVPPNILIEIQGDYWHGPLRPDIQKRDREKAQWAKENGYHLVVLWEHEIKELGAWPLLRNRLPGIFV